MTNVLITGGAGFIGSHLARSLLEQGQSVAVLDDISTGSLRNIRDLRSTPAFQFILGTTNDRSLVSELVDDADAVYHLAASVGVKTVMESPARTIENNIHGTEAVLAAAAKKGKRVLLTSTSEVYGKASKVPFSEDDDLVLGPTTKGRWSYACSKAIDEFLALSYWKEHRVPVTVARLFNTAGPGQTARYGMVLPTFARAAVSGEPLIVHGTGQQTRCFCHVRDTVNALQLLVGCPEAIGQVVNVGNPNEITIQNLACQVLRHVKSTCEIRYVDPRQIYGDDFEDMPRRVPDIAKIRRLTGWKPEISLGTIISDVVDSSKHEKGGS